jgi:hypothetical protein
MKQILVLTMDTPVLDGMVYGVSYGVHGIQLSRERGRLTISAISVMITMA